MNNNTKIKKIKIFKFLAILAFALCIFIFSMASIISFKTPNKYSLTPNSDLNIKLPLFASIKPNIEKESLNASVSNLKNQNYNTNIMFMNAIPIKDITIQPVNETKVIPSGEPFGVKIFTDGVMIVGLSDVKTENESICPAKVSGLKKGDVIISINDKKVNSNEQICEIVQSYNGNALKVHAKRGNINFDVDLKPVKSETDNTYKAGLWVRDSCAGIGTLTFFDNNANTFAGLGHGICDIDTNELLPLSHGEIVKAYINGINKSSKGNPGELKGSLNSSAIIGNLKSNSNKGVYGILNDFSSDKKELPIAMKQQIKTGNAQILCTVSGNTPEYYDIEILNINYNELSPTKNMVISVTDNKLIDQTGGIVQGMSGSPIIQNNMLVGAVTHVFVNEPTKGYAIFAENMMYSLNDICGQTSQKVS